MHTTITPAQMKELETRFMQETGVPGILLMEHAALGVVEAIGRHVPRSARVLFLCGPGNNGGDGYAAARLWAARGGAAEIWEVTDEQKGDAKVNRDLALIHCVEIHPAEKALDFSRFDAFVDALFGTGLARPVEGHAARMIHAVYDETMGSRQPIIAVDIPSGLDGTTGEALGEEGYGILRCTETVTFHRIKQGLLLREGPEFTGKVTVCPLPIPQDDELDMDFPGMEVLSPDDLTGVFRRSPTVHKGDMGRVVLFCGSQGMAGAAALCANAAMKAGAGLTNILCRESILPILQILAPGATCTVLPEKDGQLTPDAVPLARAALTKADAACIGCGLGQAPDVLPLLRLFAGAKCPVVWDADALNLLARHGALLPLKEEDVITPHFGEAARLLECAPQDLTLVPLSTLDRLHDLCGCVVLLKGARTLITDGTERFCNLYGTPAMAKGGSGDVLAGILTALLARKSPADHGMSSARQAACGALAHGLAGIRAEKCLGSDGVLPTDLIDCIRLDGEGID